MAENNVNQTNSNAESEQDVSELLKIRRQKLADLQAAGKDPRFRRPAGPATRPAGRAVFHQDSTSPIPRPCPPARASGA